MLQKKEVITFRTHEEKRRQKGLEHWASGKIEGVARSNLVNTGGVSAWTQAGAKVVNPVFFFFVKQSKHSQG